MRYLLSFFRISNILVVLATLLAYIAPFISPADFWEISLFGLAYPFLLAANIVFALFWTFVQRRWIWVSLVTIVLGWNHVGGVVGLHFSTKRPKTKSMKLISYNLNAFNSFIYKKKWLKKKYSKFYKYLAKEKGEILNFQEMTVWKRQFNFVNDSLKRYQLYDDFSSYNYLFFTGVNNSGIVKNGQISFENKNSNGATFTDVLIDKRKIRIYNLHLLSNRITLKTNQFNFKKDLFSKKIIPYGKHVLKQLKKSAKLRAKQVEEIAKHINASPHPVIVTGDFNDVPVSYTYRQLSKNLKDAFLEKGNGFGFTYNGKLPGLRLDYVLVSPEIEVIDFDIPKVDFSDHYPIICRLKIPR